MAQKKTITTSNAVLEMTFELKEGFTVRVYYEGQEPATSLQKLIETMQKIAQQINR